MLKRWIPFPLVSAALLAVWLVLNRSFSPGQVVLGTLVALLAGRTYAQIEEPRRIRVRLGAAVVLAGMVAVDLVRSNVAVARIILRAGRHAPAQSGFLEIPLEIRHPAALAALAVILTATPGTLWSGYDRETGVLTLHILDLVDESAWIETVRGRYETRLKEIFP